VNGGAHRHSVPLFSDSPQGAGGAAALHPMVTPRLSRWRARCREGPRWPERPASCRQRWQKVLRDWLTDIRDWGIQAASSVGPPHPRLVRGGVKPACDQRTATPYVVAGDAAKPAPGPRGAVRCGQARRSGGRLHLEAGPRRARHLQFSSGLWPFSTLGWPMRAPPIGHLVIPNQRLLCDRASDIIFSGWRGWTMLAGPWRDHQR